MSGSVKRTYRSTLRTTQAAETRRAVVAAAADLFVARGYAETTIDAVAAAAGVSRKTVFSAAGGKVDLLKTAVDWAIAGDDEPIALADRQVVAHILERDDPAQLLSDWAHLQADIGARVTPLFRVLEIAADAEPAAADLLTRLQHQRLDGARQIVARLRELNAVDPQRDPGQAVDLAWLATDPVLFDRLVRTRGWPVSRFAAWLGQTLVNDLLKR